MHQTAIDVVGRRWGGEAKIICLLLSTESHAYGGGCKTESHQCESAWTDLSASLKSWSTPWSTPTTPKSHGYFLAGGGGSSTTRISATIQLALICEIMRREYGNVPIAREISDALRAKIACACGNLGPPNTLTKGCVCQNNSQILAMSQSSDALLDHIADYL